MTATVATVTIVATTSPRCLQVHHALVDLRHGTGPQPLPRWAHSRYHARSTMFAFCAQLPTTIQVIAHKSCA